MDLQGSELLVSTEQTTQPFVSEEANSCHRNSGILIDDESSPNCTHERSNPETSADIEGLKLDLLILQRNVEENTRLLSIINTKYQDENASCTELLDYKKRCETLLSSVSKKDNAIKELEEKCSTFESRVLSLEQENDSLRLALTIIMQEKSDVENNQPKSNECWAHVDESRSKNGNARRSQKSVRSNTTETRNSFEPLQRLNEALVDARNEDNRAANNDDRRFRRPSCRPIDVTTQSVNDNNTYDQADENNEAAHPSFQTTEKTETTEHSANQSGTQQSKGKRSVLLIGDSMIKAIEEQRLSRSQSVKKICLGAQR